MITSFIGPYQEEDESNPPPSFLFEIRFNIRLLLTPRFSWLTISFRFFSSKISYVFFFLPRYISFMILFINMFFIMYSFVLTA